MAVSVNSLDVLARMLSLLSQETHSVSVDGITEGKDGSVSAVVTDGDEQFAVTVSLIK